MQAESQRAAPLIPTAEEDALLSSPPQAFSFDDYSHIIVPWRALPPQAIEEILSCARDDVRTVARLRSLATAVRPEISHEELFGLRAQLDTISPASSLLCSHLERISEQVGTVQLKRVQSALLEDEVLEEEGLKTDESRRFLVQLEALKARRRTARGGGETPHRYGSMLLSGEEGVLPPEESSSPGLLSSTRSLGVLSSSLAAKASARGTPRRESPGKLRRGVADPSGEDGEDAEQVVGEGELEHEAEVLRQERDSLVTAQGKVLQGKASKSQRATQIGEEFKRGEALLQVLHRQVNAVTRLLVVQSRDF